MPPQTRRVLVGPFGHCQCGRGLYALPHRSATFWMQRPEGDRERERERERQRAQGSTHTALENKSSPSIAKGVPPENGQAPWPHPKRSDPSQPEGGVRLTGSRSRGPALRGPAAGGGKGAAPGGRGFAEFVGGLVAGGVWLLLGALLVFLFLFFCCSPQGVCFLLRLFFCCATCFLQVVLLLLRIFFIVSVLLACLLALGRKGLAWVRVGCRFCEDGLG